MKTKPPKFTKIFAAHDNAAERAEYAAVVWAQTVGEMGDEIPATRAAMVLRYVLMRTEYEFFYSAATFDGPVQKGPNGGDVFNMRLSALMKIGDAIAKLEDALLIAPKSAGEKIRREENKPPPEAEKYFARTNKAH